MEQELAAGLSKGQVAEFVEDQEFEADSRTWAISWFQSNWKASPGGEAQGHMGISRRLRCRLRPRGRIAPDRIIAALVTQGPKFLENPNAGQPLPLRAGGILGEHPVKLIVPWLDLRLRLDAALIAELGGIGSDHLPDGLARHAQAPADLLERLTLLETSPSDLRNRLHTQHPKSRSRIASEASWTTTPGAPFGRRLPRYGVLFARRFTLNWRLVFRRMFLRVFSAESFCFPDFCLILTP